MTGLGWNGSKLYTSNTYSTYYEGCHTFTFSGSAFYSKSTYIDEYWGSEDLYDIAYHDGDIWAAVDNATSPIRCYEQTSGGVLEAIPSSIGIGSNIHGITYEPGTDGPFIWASDTGTDELYRIGLTSGTESASGAAIPGASLVCESNPVRSMAVISGTGFRDGATISIYDSSGRCVLSRPFDGGFTWNAAGEPRGAYFAVVRDRTGSDVLKLVRL